MTVLLIFCTERNISEAGYFGKQLELPNRGIVLARLGRRKCPSTEITNAVAIMGSGGMM